jgi:hypothetical protein
MAQKSWRRTSSEPTKMPLGRPAEVFARAQRWSWNVGAPSAFIEPTAHSACDGAGGSHGTDHGPPSTSRAPTLPTQHRRESRFCSATGDPLCSR